MERDFDRDILAEVQMLMCYLGDYVGVWLSGPVRLEAKSAFYPLQAILVVHNRYKKYTVTAQATGCYHELCG